MHRVTVVDRSVAFEPAARPPKNNEAPLNVVMLYQDSLTRHWATELWDRLRHVIGTEGIWRQSWRISELTDPCVFSDAVEGAAAADVLVVSVRDPGDWSMGLHLWIDAWLPKRAGREGALVALIGLPGQPNAACGNAHQYLEAVARKAGLDFLPRERKLPEQPVALSALPGATPTANCMAA
jgi:hypothetical protein